MPDLTQPIGDLQWGVYDWIDEIGELHVIPENDCEVHILEGCLCNPERKPLYDAQIVIHNSFDGREAFEGITKGKA